jgi:hypothetical protein
VAYLLQEHCICCPQFPQPVRKSLPLFWSSVNLCRGCSQTNIHQRQQSVLVRHSAKSRSLVSLAVQEEFSRSIPTSRQASLFSASPQVSFALTCTKTFPSAAPCMVKAQCCFTGMPSIFKKWRMRSARFDAEFPLRYPLLNPLTRGDAQVYAWSRDGHPRGEATGSEGSFLMTARGLEN